MNIFRRFPLYRLLLLCGVIVAVGASATALALALGTGPTPPAKPLAEAVHDALAGANQESIQGLSANVTLTNHLLEGANLANGSGEAGQLAASPLISGASGRLWIAKSGHVRLELQAEKGDTQILYDGSTLSIYDAGSNTLYRYTPPKQEAAGSSGDSNAQHEAPSVAKIEEAIAHLQEHVELSGAMPADVAGRAAYTVRVSPKEGGSLLDGAELSFDAANGVPLRAAVYSSTSSSPVIELAASEISYGPVAGSVFALTPPANAKVEELSFSHGSGSSHSANGAGKPTVTTHGHGITAIAVLESKTSASAAKSADESLEELPKVKINGVSASELRTELGTLLSFERSGVRYVLGGLVAPAAVEELARGL